MAPYHHFNTPQSSIQLETRGMHRMFASGKGVLRKMESTLACTNTDTAEQKPSWFAELGGIPRSAHRQGNARFATQREKSRCIVVIENGSGRIKHTPDISIDGSDRGPFPLMTASNIFLGIEVSHRVTVREQDTRKA